MPRPGRRLLALALAGARPSCAAQAPAPSDAGYVVQRLPLPPDQLRAGGHGHPRLPEDHGHEGRPGRRCSAFRCSRPGPTATPATSRRLTTCRPTRRSTTTRSPTRTSRWRTGRCTKERAGALRPDDHRLQPRGHVRGRPHQARAADVPRRVLRDRRVHDPQGVRLLEDRRRDGQPHQPGARPHPRLRGRGRPRGHPAQRHRHAVPEARAGAVPGRRSSATLFRRHPRTTIIWAHCGLGRIVRPVEGPARASSSARSAIPGSPTSRSTSPGTRWRSTSSATPEAIQAAADLINRHPDRFLFGTDEVAPHRAGEVPQGLRHVRAAVREADAGGEREGAQGQLRAPLRRGARARAGSGRRPTSK